MKKCACMWEDCTVRATDGDVGTVAQFYFDDLTWTIRYMAVHTTGRVPGNNVLIPAAALGRPDWKKKVFPVRLAMAQVRSSPLTESDAPVSNRYETAVHAHYAQPNYWGGGFYLQPGEMHIETAPRDTKPASGMHKKVDPHLHSMQELQACRVHAADGSLGHVEDFLVDEAWAIRYLVVNTRNWLPNRQVLVSPHWIRRANWADKQIFVDLAREAVETSPEFDPSKPFSRADEGQLLGHLQKTEIKEWVIFKFHAPPGAKIFVAGSFNNWDDTAIKLGENAKGSYIAMVLLPPGRYEYKFVVDGKWKNGPDGALVPNALGTSNNELIVSRKLSHHMHLHTFSRLPASNERLLVDTPVGG